MILDQSNLSAENLRICTGVALGVARQCLAEYGWTWEDFVAAHPELINPIIPADLFRAALISGK